VNNFNNDVTYHDKWDTKENKEWSNKLEPLLNRSECHSHCPKSWAKESYYFLKDLDEKFGLSYSEGTHKGYFFQNDVYTEVIIAPFRLIPHTIKSIFSALSIHQREYILKKYPTRWSRVKRAFYRSYIKPIDAYIHKASHKFYATIYNKRRKPQIEFSQFKEKFGTIRFYYSAPKWIQNYVEDELCKLEIALSKKGAYYPIEEMKDWCTSWSDYDHSYEVEEKEYSEYQKRDYVKVSHYKYRKFINEEEKNK
jgi:hypothetical protein